LDPQAAHRTGLLICRTVFACWIVFGGRFHSALKNYPLEFLCVPFLIWAAFSFGRRRAATAIAFLAAMATWGTTHGFGPFSRESQNTSLLLLQAFVGVMAITTMVLAAEVTEHKRADERVHHLAVTDPLTGSPTTGAFSMPSTPKSSGTNAPPAPFALVLLDLDGLKKIQ